VIAWADGQIDLLGLGTAVWAALTACTLRAATPKIGHD
jgi:hypothetical protein